MFDQESGITLQRSADAAVFPDAPEVHRHQHRDGERQPDAVQHVEPQQRPFADERAAEQRKPHPQPLLYACEALQVSASQAIMVGDSATDVLAARAAGLSIVCVPYGYNEGADPRALPCDAFIDSIAELPQLLFGAPLPAGTAASRARAHPGK